MFYKIVLIFAVFAILTGCDRGQQMMKPIVQDVSIDESVSEDTLPMEPAREPIIHFPIEIDGIVQEETREVFTSSDAAIDSERFRKLLNSAKEYNLEWCGKMDKPSWRGSISIYNGNPQDESPYKFHFIDEAAAKEFEEKVNSDYSDHLKNTKTVIPERFGWWGSIDIRARCGF